MPDTVTKMRAAADKQSFYTLLSAAKALAPRICFLQIRRSKRIDQRHSSVGAAAGFAIGYTLPDKVYSALKN